ncbi:bifunctional glyoxylate/hydroxypyruvate reductase B, partial [Salmonella enterica subsp. enterica serovar Enteritidis str. SE30663]
MKPSIILYKTLPDDLLHRLEAHFTVTQVPNLHPETVARHAQAFASAQGLLGASETVNRALLEKMPALRAASTISCEPFTASVLSSESAPAATLV